MTALISPLRDVGMAQLADVGGKNANLGVLLRDLEASGVRVPEGFAIHASAFRQHLRAAQIEERIYAALDRLDVRDVTALARVGREIRELVEAAPLGAELSAAIADAYATLSRRYGEAATDVAVRSSATAEDLPEASFAGQQESYLNVRGVDALLRAVRACMASLFTDRAIVYRVERGFSHRATAISVGVQKMVRSDLACAGVMFTLDTESGFRDVIQIAAAYGLGESIVQGRVSPDEYLVFTPLLDAFRPILERRLGAKELRVVYAEGGATREVQVAQELRHRYALGDDDILTLARWGRAIALHHGKPMDIEWAKDGTSGELFVVQARPETVHSRAVTPTLAIYELGKRGAPIVTGVSVGTKIAVGPARIVRDASALVTVQPGEVLVAPMTDPDWEPVLARAAAIVTERGGRTCHAAIVARELGIPCVVGAERSTERIATGDRVTVSCAEGSEGRVYAGDIPYQRTVIDPATLPRSPVPIMLNVGNPENAFVLGQLPSAGVGLARIEFIISSQIRIHPMALLHPELVPDHGTRLLISDLARQCSSPAELFVDGLASGVARIAAAFYPRPVIVRFSDFKTNEYARLLGGSGFEPVEANPMIGFRGASRYYHPRYREAFGLECRAIARVRDTMGLHNVKVMVPFCRTLEEGRRVLAEMARHGLVRGERDLEVYVMCEIPNNVILASDFAKLFDGFSIGSNDLTQLVLGVDRDSALLAEIFDEQDPGVLAMISQVIESAHRAGRHVGLCGQAPSDHPEFARLLVDRGIDSISVTPDAFARVVQQLADHPPTTRRHIGQLCVSGDAACEQGDFETLRELTDELAAYVPEPRHCELREIAHACGHDPHRAMQLWTEMKERLFPAAS